MATKQHQQEATMMRAKTTNPRPTQAEMMVRYIECRQESCLFDTVEKRMEMQTQYFNAIDENDEETIYNIEHRILVQFYYMKLLWETVTEEFSAKMDSTVNERC